MSTAELVYLSILAATLGTMAVLLTNEFLRWIRRRRSGGPKDGSEMLGGGGTNPA